MSARRRPLAILAAAGAGALGVVLIVAATVMALLGAEVGCLGGGGGGGTALASPPTRAAAREIAPARLRVYQAAGRRFDIEWTFLASIGTQECGSGRCAGVNGSGCAGPMQIAYVRGSPCSPGSGPTIWEIYRFDGGGDETTDVNDPADAIFTAARILRAEKGAPPAGGSYTAYREAACGYYGACADGVASYADEVMARALSYGFGGGGTPRSPAPAASVPASYSGTGCAAPTGVAAGRGPLGPVRKAFALRRLAPLPSDVAAYPGIECDARIVPGVTYLARRFGVVITSCYSGSGHSASGEHPLGAAIDAGPRGAGWAGVERLARAAGWRPSCATSGVRPACARPPFRFVGYNGFPNHGDPAHCVPCAGGPHIHLSWMTSASSGQPGNRPRYSYEPAAWIEVLPSPGSERGTSPRPRGGK